MSRPPQSQSTRRRTGRRPGNPDTKEEILAAARAQFAAKGYQGATIRAIADAAGVNVALVPHYFGSKEQLFAAAQHLPESVRAGMAEALRGGGLEVGDRLTRAYLGLWEEEATRAQLLATVRSTLTTEHGMALLRGMSADALIADDPSVDPARRRALGLAMGQLLGVAILRHVTVLPTVAEIPYDDLVAAVAPAVQLHLDRAAGPPGDLPREPR